ncbi:MAG: formate dehydrogenase accessory sulfurtransferase FdhD [Polyangiales bacterium]
MDERSVLRAVVRPPVSGESEESFDRVVVEEPLEIRVAGEPIAVTMRTPGDDRDLAVGFLLTEGVLHDPREVLEVTTDKSSIDLRLASGVDASRAKRALFSASSCGLCGKETIASIAVKVPPVEAALRVPLSTLLALPEAMRAAQPTFDRTGGLHAAAIFDREGKLEVLREDIGRHNATDKAIGAHAYPLGDRILLVSGRAGFEIVQKAAVARIPIVAAISAPSSLAVDLAERLGITLVAFLRPPRASVYTHARRVIFDG